VREIRGFEPVALSRAFLRLLVTGSVPRDFAFRFTNSTTMGYTGVADKRGVWSAAAVARDETEKEPSQ
jgi:hypothetical protein